ncbi:DUF4054 domain-containing protein [Rhizobium sp. Root1220]|uniref:DUF4054 domain-containing protein n=1 Tax=Rhizobium sp. Root1220 TaxID=1736432 RepID=UPI0009E98808|nr:DUF4054 domain-containing protein [Rhizobium sp. Root1220]
MVLDWPSKDPDEVKDYRLDWGAQLGDDDLATSVWSIVSGVGLTIGVQSNDPKSSTVWLSAGTSGVTYELLNRVTTTGGRTYDQSVLLPVVDGQGVVPGPNAQTFKARYPEFASVSSTLINMVLADAVDMVGESWYQRDRLKAQLLWTAHTLTMEGEPGRSSTGQGTAGTGVVKRRKVGDVETEFATPGGSSGGGSASGYASTTYGQQFMALMRRNFPAVAVV